MEQVWRHLVDRKITKRLMAGQGEFSLYSTDSEEQVTGVHLDIVFVYIMFAVDIRTYAEHGLNNTCTHETPIYIILITPPARSNI